MAPAKPMPPAGSDQKRVKVLDEVENADLNSLRNEYHFRTPILTTALARLLTDPRDEPMICLMLNIVQAIVPGVALVYGINMWQPQWPLLTRNVAGLAYYLVILILFQERFTLCLHFASHRPIFKRQYDFLNGIMVWILSPFFGIPCGLYKLHHVIMHHIENNHELDISSTEFYQRDSWWNFFCYYVRFSFFIWGELPYYTIRTKRYEWTKKVCFGLAVWMATIWFLATYVNFLATVWVFVVPHLVSMAAMSFGNWSQHIFVNPYDSRNNYALSYNCIDTPVNKTTFNDGYHIIHHVNARCHWSEMPNEFYKNKEKHIEGGALTFSGVHFFDVGFLVMTKQLRKLAEHYVHLGDASSAPGVDAVEERLRAWLKPVQDNANLQSKKVS